MNTNLSFNEKQLFASEKFQAGTQLKEYKKVHKAEQDLRVRRFFKAMEIAHIAESGLAFFQSKECKELMKIQAVKWTTEEFISKVYGLQKSYFYKLVRFAGFTHTNPELVDKFVAEAEILGVNECLSYINAILNPKPEKVETVDMDVETVDMDVETVESEILPVNTAGKFSLKDVEKLFAHASKADIEASIEYLFSMIK